LLIIPFVSPMIADALRDVPNDLKEASLALGASRWRTLTRITLPNATPGIVSAASIGALKAIGDVMIASWVVGSQPTMPDPLFDLLQNAVPLASTGPALLGGFAEAERVIPHEASVGYLTGLLLLIMAFAILGVAAIFQRLLAKRFAR
jgi:ABC-type phosphate transport system permease subunit